MFSSVKLHLQDFLLEFSLFSDKNLILLFSGSAWNFDDDTDSTTSSENMTTGSDDVGTHKAPTPLYYTTPPKAVSLFITKY